MTTRILGPTRSRRRRRFLLAPILFVALAALFVTAGAQAIHDDNYFELEGNILGDNSLANGPDWGYCATAGSPGCTVASTDGIFDADGNPTGGGAAGAAALAFIKDDLSQGGASDRTTFSGAGGSNKNNDDIFGSSDTWHWDSGNVPAKDDLSNVYAYATFPTSGEHAGDLILYAGFERIDSSGDSHIDIEFLQDNIALDETAPCNDPGSDTTPCSFTGTTSNGRTVGDIIVSMEFTTGGSIGEVNIREWDGTEYVFVEQLPEDEVCDALDLFCAINNGGTINGGPWPNFDRHGAVITDLPQNAFTEFGVNVTELLDETPCISTFMGKTRSSDSFTAELKDFAGPTSFPLCSLAWEKRNGSVATPHPLQSGATFSVMPNPHTNAPGSSLTGITDCTASPCSGEDKDPDAGQFLITNAVAGTFTITETAAPSGFSPDPDNTRVATIGSGSLSAVVGTQGIDDDGYVGGVCTSEECDFHNFRPAVKVTALGYTNTPTGSPTAGSGTVEYTAKVKNFGEVSTTLSGSLAVTPAAMDCVGEPDDTLDISGALAAGAEATFTLTCSYTSFADGTSVAATLNVSYTTNSLTRVASGSPATVSFTVQTD
jgi:hypothetical protein